MIQLANPIWLWGLTGLLVPLGIHLLSRKEGKTIYIGSLRHLTESDSAQFSSIRLNEIRLLVLRCLLLTLIVLLLAGFSVSFRSGKSGKWLVIEKGIETGQTLKPFIDSLVQSDYELRFLSENFPEAGKNTNVSHVSDYWLLAEELGSRPLEDAIVISYNYLPGFKGQRIASAPGLKWITLEPGRKEFVAKAVQVNNDSVWMRTGESWSTYTRFESKYISNRQFQDLNKTDSVQLQRPDTIRVAVFADQAFEYDRKILNAALRAVQSITPAIILISSKQTGEPADPALDWIFWLSEKTPALQRYPVIGYSDCTISSLSLLEPAGPHLGCNRASFFKWVITKRLTEETVLNDNFTSKLAEILLSGSAGSRIQNNDVRSLLEQALWSRKENRTQSKAFAASDALTEPWLVIILLLVLLLERWLSYKRSQ